jgi:hypothetical protein
VYISCLQSLIVSIIERIIAKRCVFTYRNPLHIHKFEPGLSETIKLRLTCTQGMSLATGLASCCTDDVVRFSVFLVVQVVKLRQLTKLISISHQSRSNIPSRILKNRIFLMLVHVNTRNSHEDVSTLHNY